MLISNTATALLAGAFTFTIGSFLHGTNGDDHIYGTAASETIFGYAGNDSIYGEDGDDTCFGGDGGDFISGGDGEDRLYGGPGDDTLRAGPGDDFMQGGPGDDLIDIWGRLDFTAGPTTPIEAGDCDLAVGGSGDDTFTWASGRVYFIPLPTLGSALLHSGDAFVSGGSGHDTIRFGVGSFAAYSSDYAIHHGPAGICWIESLESGAVLTVVGVEELVFLDGSVSL
ncbi:MAG: hypothetical protein H6838_14510 [Planctomycetes bacterium]|nr:hypothetical protein [Planctomycetota bacterium]MCB9886703.1 hypothetical protein [Planctomycetota bacterium]